MIKAVLFDLDGTLLPMDHKVFAQAYLKLLSSRVVHLVDPEKFIRQLLTSTTLMVSNCEPERTNQEVFYAHFLAGLNVPAEQLLPVLEDFYARDFSKLRFTTRASAAARRAVTAVLGRGLDAVVATNPIFPLTAIRQRLAWADLHDIPFRLITSYEDFHFCKPNPEYYREIAGRLGHLPGECLMVGNDVEEDLVAGSIGMRTYLVTDCLINTKGLEPKADYTGTLAELADFLVSWRVADGTG